MASVNSHPTEQDPLLSNSSTLQSESQPPPRVKKPWYRPRPLWLLPFAITAALCRGMTLAPRTEVFVQLACENLRISRHHSHHRHTDTVSSSIFPFNNTAPYIALYTDTDALVHPALVLLKPVSPPFLELDDEDKVKDPHTIDDDNPINCNTDARVQAGAARMQTIMTTTMGILSAITTGWWGQFGDRHGRTKVLTAAAAGLLFTDVMFIIASSPPAVLKGHAHLLLIVAPIVEGLLGGYATLQGTTYAYLSDCTSQGSRAHIFSRFTGAHYIGFAAGPEIAALILRNTHMTTFVFYVSAFCATINLFLIFLVFPESLSAQARSRNIKATNEAKIKASHDAAGKTGFWRSTKLAMRSFVEPLEVLGPVQRAHGRGRDWSLTLLAAGTFCFHLSVGIISMKYLYTKDVFNWDAESLSYYITSAGCVRALYLLFILPSLIAIVKPGFKPHLLRRASEPVDNEEPGMVSSTVPNDDAAAADQPAVVATSAPKKPAPSPSALLREIKFDLLVAKLSVLVDITSHSLVTLAASSSVPLFVGFSLVSSTGAGLLPAIQSVAMSTLNLRENSQGGKGGREVGKLFGALSMLQAIGSSILGPVLFGTVYSVTVAAYPKAIFIVAASLLIIAMMALIMIRPPRVDVPIEIRVERHVSVQVERTVRGRTRGRKNITVT